MPEKAKKTRSLPVRSLTRDRALHSWNGKATSAPRKEQRESSDSSFKTKTTSKYSSLNTEYTYDDTNHLFANLDANEDFNSRFRLMSASNTQLSLRPSDSTAASYLSAQAQTDFLHIGTQFYGHTEHKQEELFADLNRIPVSSQELPAASYSELLEYSAFRTMTWDESMWRHNHCAQLESLCLEEEKLEDTMVRRKLG